MKKNYVPIAVMFILGGLFFVSLGIKDLGLPPGQETWKETRGKVFSYEVSGPSEDIRQGPFPTYSTNVKYEYSVNGDWYSSSEGSEYWIEHSEKDKLKRMSGKYKSGDEIVVFYNPDQPEQSALTLENIRNLKGVAVVFCSIGFFMLLISFLMLNTFKNIKSDYFNEIVYKFLRSYFNTAGVPFLVILISMVLSFIIGYSLNEAREIIVPIWILNLIGILVASIYNFSKLRVLPAIINMLMFVLFFFMLAQQ